MSRYITVRLTVRQAKALLHAAGNSLIDKDDAMAVFGEDGRMVESAYRAMFKLQDEITNEEAKT